MCHLKNPLPSQLTEESNMEKQIIFADGLMWKDPHEKAPAWVKGDISINVSKFKSFLDDNIGHISEKGWMKIVMKESKSGSIYFELDTWKPTQPSTDTFTSPSEDYPDGIDMNNLKF